MSAFTLVSIFLTLLVSSFPAVFAPLVADLQKSIDGAVSQISAVGYISELEGYVADIKRHLWWLRFVMTIFVLYFVFYLVIIIGYIRVAALTMVILTHLFPARYLHIVPEVIRRALVDLHKSLLKIDVQPLDRVLLCAALLLSAVVFWRSPMRIYRRAKSVLREARKQIEFLHNRPDR